MYLATAVCGQPPLPGGVQREESDALAHHSVNIFSAAKSIDLSSLNGVSITGKQPVPNI